MANYTPKDTPLFGGPNADQYNALMDSLKKCAKDENKTIYEFLDDTPKTSLVVLLIDKLHEMGFAITKAK